MYSRRPVVRRTAFRRRRRHNWQWVRSSENYPTVITPATFGTHDLLLTWRTQFGITLNLPDIVVWRILIRISIRVTFPTTGFDEAQGALVALFVDDVNQSPVSAVIQPYSYRYLMWDTAYASEQFYQGSTAAISAGENLVLYRNYDIKSHRRLQNMNDTLLLQVAPLNTTQIEGIAFTQSTLLKIGR